MPAHSSDAWSSVMGGATVAPSPDGETPSPEGSHHNRKGSNGRRDSAVEEIADSPVVVEMRGYKKGLFYDEGNFFRDSLTPVGFVSPTSEFQEYWDIVMLMMMIYVVFVTPFEVCFVESVITSRPLFWFNRFVDLFFLCDMVSSGHCCHCCRGVLCLVPRFALRSAFKLKHTGGFAGGTIPYCSSGGGVRDG